MSGRLFVRLEVNCGAVFQMDDIPKSLLLALVSLF